MRTQTSISCNETSVYLMNNVKMITRMDELHDYLFVLRRIVLREFFMITEKKRIQRANAFSSIIYLPNFIYHFRSMNLQVFRKLKLSGFSSLEKMKNSRNTWIFKNVFHYTHFIIATNYIATSSVFSVWLQNSLRLLMQLTKWKRLQCNVKFMKQHYLIFFIAKYIWLFKKKER